MITLLSIRAKYEINQRFLYFLTFMKRINEQEEVS